MLSRTPFDRNVEAAAKQSVARIHSERAQHNMPGTWSEPILSLNLRTTYLYTIGM